LLARERIDCAILHQQGYDDAVGSQVCALAPTVREPDPLTRPGVVSLLGRVLAREDDLAEIDAARTRKLTAWEPSRRPASVTVYFAISETEAFVFARPNTIGRFLAEVGLDLKDRGRPPGEDGFSLTVENITQLDDEVVMAIAPYADYGPELDAMERDSLFENIPAVQAGRYTRLTYEESAALISHSSLAVDTALAGLSRALG